MEHQVLIVDKKALIYNCRMRLDKYLANSRAGSRSEVKEHIRCGRVLVNGFICKDPATHVDEADEVTLVGTAVAYKKNVCYMLNKPAGVISATEDATERTVIDLFPPDLRKGLFPIGRLDKDSVGLLLITDDGDLSHRLMSPKNHVDKRYLIRTDIPLDEVDVSSFKAGITLGDGTDLLPASLEISPYDPTEAVVTISEGKYHQVKRMIASCGKKVVYLKRISIGDLQLDPDLAEGAFRELTDKELGTL